MELYIMRHGPAEEDSASGSDADRELTPKGRDRVRSVARELVRRQEVPTLIVTSPLVRAAQTAEIVLAECGQRRVALETRRELAMGEAAIDLVKELVSSKKDRVMLVGHQPDLSALIHGVAGVSIDMEKAMIVGLTLQTKKRGQVRFVLHPKTLDWTTPSAGSD